MGNSANKAVPIVVISVAASASCAIWRRYFARTARSQTLLFKVFVPVKESCSRIDDKIWFSSLVVKDCLSELPVEVSSQILLRLTTRDVARVATLSRHLRNVCLALPHLNLDWLVMSGVHDLTFHVDKKCKPYEEAYVKNVDQVLEKYRDQNILSFHLSCCLDSKTYGDDMDRWMSFVAAYKGLQSLSLEFICVDHWRMSFQREYDELHLITGSFISQFSYLKDLHLDACILRLENGFRFSNLSSLHLSNVILEGSKWQGVFSCSSTIERLWLRRCKLPGKLCIGNNFPCLSFLMIGSCLDLRELEVSAWALQRFDVSSDEPLKCSFFNVPNLESVYFHPMWKCCPEDILNDLAAKVPSLKYLFLRGRCAMNLLPTPAPIFHSVSFLRLSMNEDDGNLLTVLPRLLKVFPQMKKLEMKLPFEPRTKTYKLPIPHLHNKLEYIKIFAMRVQYIPIAMYLLKSAVMLDHMVLSKATKALAGYDNLHWWFFDAKYTDEERSIIRDALFGKASSTNMELIIK